MVWDGATWVTGATNLASGAVLDWQVGLLLPGHRGGQPSVYQSGRVTVRTGRYTFGTSVAPNRSIRVRLVFDPAVQPPWVSSGYEYRGKQIPGWSVVTRPDHTIEYTADLTQ